MNSIVTQINALGDKIFYTPSSTYSYEELTFSPLKTKKVLRSSTYRGFHKVFKNGLGPKDIFQNFLKTNQEFIVSSLLACKVESDIDNFSNKLSSMLRESLGENIKPMQLESFNKIRKPINIIIEHLVSLSQELTPKRGILIPLLHLPLDSWMFQSELVFSDAETKSLNIKRSFSFKDIKNEEHYYEIQNFLKEKAKLLGIHHRIYFDLIWGDRYRKDLGNLFADSF